MFLWRISSHCTLNGSGGERASGRWHTALPGKPIVYLAEHPAVALVETIANLKGAAVLAPEAYQLIQIRVPRSVIPEELEASALPKSWATDRSLSQKIGDQWLNNGSSALLRVPSVPSPESWNYLLNPRHEEAGQIIIEWCRWIAYDARIFGLREKG